MITCNMKGRGSWSMAIDKAKLLLDSDVAVNALTVVNEWGLKSY